MSKMLNKRKPILELDSTKSNEIVEIINEYINESQDEDLTIDISRMNILDACRISVLGSTEHYIKNPNANINWVVSSESVEKMVSAMGLGNSSFLCK